LTPGQELAIEQLQRIEAVSHSKFRIVRIDEPQPGYRAKVLVDIDCSEIKRTPDGLPLRQREKFTIYIPEQFPFEYPSVWVNHARFAGFTHVQWKYFLCLYLSPKTEWNPSDGMFGFIDRLSEWLSMGAVNSHELDGQPLHPPVIYNIDYDKPFIVTQADSPTVHGHPWLGFAKLEEKSNKRHDLVSWKKLDELQNTDSFLAAAVLLHEALPLEYPASAACLFKYLESQGVSLDLLQFALTFASLFTSEDLPLYLVIGTPMRGIKGAAPRQHLAVWSFPDGLRRAVKTQIDAQLLGDKLTDEEAAEKCRNISSDCKKLVREIIEISPLSWRSVEENRTEVTQRRDLNTPISWFKNKRVALWGCGALGSHIAESLVRAGIDHITLRDNKKVTPGILVRQNFIDEDIGEFKADALSQRLKQIQPALSTSISTSDIGANLKELPELTEANNVDVIIDTTASSLLSVRFEYYLKSHPLSCPMMSAITGQSASSAIITIKPQNYRGGQYEIHRRAKISAGHSPELKPYLDEFWPDDDKFINFQPEPGCSDPTFIGSGADMMQLCGSIINKGAEYLNQIVEDSSYSAWVAFLAGKNSKFQNEEFEYSTYITAPSVGSAEVRISQQAWKKMEEVIQNSSTHNDKMCETGGLLFGQFDQAAGIIWISEIMGPPPDSKATPEHFECGIENTEEENNRLSNLSRGSVEYLGMWHTHPVSEAKPSQTDIGGMTKIIFDGGFTSAHQMLLIVGFSATKPEVGTYMFSTTHLAHSKIRQLLLTEINIKGATKKLKDMLDEV